ncbi:MAG: glycosyltransferase family 1 protein [Caulobacterales bacterium]
MSIYNRTGKFFIGKDILDTCHDLIGDVYYAGLRRKAPPSDLIGKIAGRLQHLQIINTALGGPLSLLPKQRAKRPILHIDPITVLAARLTSMDAVICHDMGPLSHPYLFDSKTGAIYAEAYKKIAQAGPHLIFVSKATERAFESFFPNAPVSSKRVIYPAIRQVESNRTQAAVSQIDGPFLLTVGAIGIRKNQLTVIKAFQNSGLAERGVKYVLCGAKEPGYQAVEAAAHEVPGVVLLSYVSDSELNWLYAHAKGFILASLLEGFGMPVAEAISFGQVPLVSSNSVLEEVAGDAAIAVDPSNESMIRDALLRLSEMSEPELDVRRIQLNQSIARFDGDKIAQEWRGAITEILG